MLELYEVEKQLILYTKCHFGKVDYDNDLKYFAAELYALHVENVEQYSVNYMVVTLYEKLVDNGLIGFSLSYFLTNIFKRSRRDHGQSDVNWRIILRQMLAEIQGMPVLDKGLDLGKADLSILNAK